MVCVGILDDAGDFSSVEWGRQGFQPRPVVSPHRLWTILATRPPACVQVSSCLAFPCLTRYLETYALRGIAYRVPAAHTLEQEVLVCASGDYLQPVPSFVEQNYAFPFTCAAAVRDIPVTCSDVYAADPILEDRHPTSTASTSMASGA